MTKFCAAFRPRTREQQIAAIGLSGGQRPKDAALCRCLDPSGGEWEEIDHPRDGEWLQEMIDRTPDQTFKDFYYMQRNSPEASRRTIYLQPLCKPEDLEGDAFPGGSWPSWSFLQTAVEHFYSPMKVVALPAIPMENLRPRPANRQNVYGTQWHAAQVLDAIAGKLPKDAFCMLAVTMCDLYPRPEWNFVYGLARLTGRVGVFSFVRHTPERRGGRWSEAQLLHRACKTMLHEIGHMFGLKHCTWFNCMMRGSNGEGIEHQTNYLHLCPVCLRKLHSCLGFDIVATYKKLLTLFQEYEAHNELFQKDCLFLRQRIDALQSLPQAATASVPKCLALTSAAPQEGGAVRGLRSPAAGGRGSSSRSISRRRQSK